MGTDVRGRARQPRPSAPASGSGPGAGRLARRARTVRRVTAVPLWGVFVSGAVLTPWFALGDDGTWQVVSLMFTLPVTAVLLVVRAVPTRRYLAAVRTGPRVVYTQGFRELPGERRAQTVFAALGVLAAPLLLTATTSAFARQLVPTTPATATVTACTLHSGAKGSGPLAVCDGSWTVDGRTYLGALPVRSARPGSRLPVLARSGDPGQIYLAQTLSSTAPGIAFGLLALTVGLGGAAGLRRRSRWLNAQLRESVAAAGPTEEA